MFLAGERRPPGRLVGRRGTGCDEARPDWGRQKGQVARRGGSEGGYQEPQDASIIMRSIRSTRAKASRCRAEPARARATT